MSNDKWGGITYYPLSEYRSHRRRSDRWVWFWCFVFVLIGVLSSWIAR